jgi:AraC-like DNA-binding protein/mannose-6-phosphate isomerase-like protein (cupin superfamily)
MSNDPSVLHLDWKSELPNGCVRVGRHALTIESRRMPPHDHEFAEIFWVEVGRCEHHIGGHVEYLEPHEYRCIRPEDVHGVYCDGNPCSLVNISFRPETVAELAERYQEDWLWPAESPPRGGVLPPMARERLSAWLDILAAPRLRQIDLDSFLLDLTRALTLEQVAPRSTGLPVWLAEALEVFTQPRNLCGGVVELARLCGRSREHINRIVRSSQGRRATDLVNSIRLDWVAQQLRVTDVPVEELAARCGLPNLAHFYRLFRAAYGETPAAWRRKVRVAFPRNEALNVSPWGRQ